MKKKYSLTIDDDDEIFTVDPVRIQILNKIAVGKKCISSMVGKALNIKRRRALEFLDRLEDEGYLESKLEIIQHKSGARCKTRVFTRVK